MADIELPLGGGFYKHRNLPLSHQELVNGCLRVSEVPGTRTELSVVSGPGIKSFLTLPETKCRGLHEFQNKAYAVAGTGLYQINEDATSTLLGSIPGTEFCSMANNGTQLVVVRPGQATYVWDTATSTFQQITTANFLGPFNTVLYKDSFFVFFKNDIFQNSNANDGTTYTATDFGSAESDPDDTVTAITNNNQMFIFGRRTGEIQQTQGGSGFPFIRVGGGVIEKGCAGKFLITNIDTTFVWVGHGRDEKPSIYRYTGGLNMVKISTQPIDQALADYSEDDLENSQAYNYMIDGYAYALFEFPDKSFIYDLTSSEILGYPVWMQRKTTGSETSRIQGIAKAYGKILVGDKNTGNIGYLDMNEHQEYGNNFTWSVSVGPFSNANRRSRVTAIELDMKTGVANDNDSDPVVYLRMSDNGVQFRDPFFRSLGGSGKYDKIVEFRKKGSFKKNRVINIYSASPVDRTLNRIIARVPDG